MNVKIDPAVALAALRIRAARMRDEGLSTVGEHSGATWAIDALEALLCHTGACAVAEPTSRLQGLIADSTPVFEEIADCCETVSKSIRALNVLTGAEADPLKCVPHLQTAMRAFQELDKLAPRLEAIVGRYND